MTKVEFPLYLLIVPDRKDSTVRSEVNRALKDSRM